MRSARRILLSLSRPQHYVSVARSRIYEDWADFFVRRYVLGCGTYPYTCSVKTPIGLVHLTLRQHEDCFTVQEIFGLECYKSRGERVFVDFGANVGISAAYFLSRNPSAIVHCFEPLAANASRLRENLEPYKGRWTLTEVALADHTGELSFRVEPTGRFSGVECTNGIMSTFPCMSATEALGHIIAKHRRIDVLKMDIEGAEDLFMPTMKPEILARIGTIYIEGQYRYQLPGFYFSTTVSGVHCYKSRG